MAPLRTTLLVLAAATLAACQPTIGDAPNLGSGTPQPDASPSIPSGPDASLPNDTPDAGGGGDDSGGDDSDDDDGGGELTLSQNIDDEILDAHSIGCVQQDDDGNPVQNRENSYYRVFDLEAEGVDGDFEVTEVHVAIESAATPDDSAQPVTVRLHSVAGALRLANMTQLATVDLDVEPQSNTVIDVPIRATAAAGSQLAVELFVPNSTTNRLLFIGSNDAGQRAPSFIRGPSCSIAEPTDFALLPDGGFPDVHILLSVTGEVE